MCKSTSSLLSCKPSLKVNQYSCSDCRLTATSWGMISQIVVSLQEKSGLVKLTETSSTPDKFISQGKLFSPNSYWDNFPYGLITGKGCREPWFGHSDLDLYTSLYECGSFFDRSICSQHTDKINGWSCNNEDKTLNCGCNSVESSQGTR